MYSSELLSAMLSSLTQLPAVVTVPVLSTVLSYSCTVHYLQASYTYTPVTPREKKFNPGSENLPTTIPYQRICPSHV